MKEFFQALLDSSPFIPHGHCYLWKPELVGLHVVSDTLIAIAYYSIPIALMYFVEKRQDLPFNKIFLWFGAFILTCGTTHLLEVWTLWHPVYWLSGGVKLITAVISLYTAIALIFLLPQALALPGLAVVNQRLEAEIAERQKTEVALRESEERFRSTFEQAAVGIAHVSLSGQFLRLNQRFGNIVGYLQAELQSLTFQAIAHPDDWAADQQRMHNLLNGSIQTDALEKRCICKNRSLIWINLTVSLVRDHLGEPEYFIATIEDISDRKWIELALQQSEATLKLFVKYVPAGVAMLDTHFRYVFASQRWLEDYKLDPVEFITGRSHYEIFPEVPDRWRQIHQRCLAGAIERSEEDLFERADGSQQWIRWEIRPWYAADQSIGGIMIFSEDITERKRAETSLEESEERLRLALMSANQGIYDVNVQTGEVIVNPSYATMLGYDPANFQESAVAWMERLHPDDRDEAARLYQNYVAGNISEYRSEFRLKNSRGDWMWILSLGKMVDWDQDGCPLRMLGTHTDITDRKQVEAEKLKAEKLRLELHLLENILEVALAGYWDWNIPENQQYLSPTLKRMLGYEDYELLNTPETWQWLIFAEDLSEVMERFEQHVKSRGQIPFYNEVRYRHRDGSTIWLISSGRVIEWDPDGNPLRMVGCHIDITERKQAEEKLRNLSDRLTLALKSGAIGAWEWDFVHPVDWDNRMYELYGIPRLEAAPPFQDWLNFFVHPDDRSFVEETHYAALQNNSDIDLEFRIIRPDGHICFLKACALIQRTESNEPLRIVGISYDISDRKQAEQELTRSWDLREAIFNESADALFLVDPDTLFTLDCNRRAVELFGAADKAELIGIQGQTLQRYSFSEQELAAVVAEMQAKGFWSQEIEYVTRQGNVFWGNIAAKPIVVAGRTMNLVRVTDISDRKQAEEALANYAREIEDLYNNAPCGYHSLDAEGCFVNVNETELQWLGYTRAEMIGKSFADFVDEAGRLVFEQSYPIFKQQGWVRDLEFNLIRKDGTRLPVLLSATAVRNEEGQYLHSRSTLFDIRDRQQAEAQLRLSNERISLANAELARAARLKDEFLAGMSHELRTPLNAVLGLSEALLEEVYGDLTPNQRDSLQTIETSGQHLLALINDILDLAKIESGKMELDLSAVGVQSLCESSLTFVKQQANHKQIRLSCQIADGLTEIEADERRLRQVLVNLLSNAVKFTPENGSVQLQVRADSQREVIEFSVTDTGIGIASENVNQLFQPFVQLDSSLSRRYEGTGLGLSLVRRIMDLHMGSVFLESEVGKGSCFTIALPWKLTPHMRDPVSDRGLLKSTPPSIERALIVEDSEAAASQIARYLTELGAKVLVHSQGGGALDAAIQSKPDLIILDILLPDQTGWEVLIALKANPATQNIPVIVVSVVDSRSRGLDLGAAECLLKPITRHHLQQVLKQVFPTIQPPVQTALVLTSDRSFSQPLILLAEDNEANSIMTTRYLQARGLRVVVARNGLEAIQMAQQQQPELILMDVQMPEVDGLQATRRIRSDAKLNQIPIIALTALAMPGDRERCLAAGANEYMTKPVSFKHLLHLIATYVPALRLRE